MDEEFSQLYSAYFMKVYCFVLNLSRNQDLAEELTQKTFFKAMTAAGKHRGEASEFTWLCAIAKNLFIDECRRQKPLAARDPDGPADTDIEKAFVNQDTAFEIHCVLHDMEEPYKEVFQLRVFGELSFQKIGMIFGKTETWARVTHHRARLKIQERMEE